MLQKFGFVIALVACLAIVAPAAEKSLGPSTVGT